MRKQFKPGGKKQSRPASGRPSRGPIKQSSQERDERTFSNEPRSKVKVELPQHERVVIGTHAILEAIKTNPKACKEVWFRQGWESSQDLKQIQSELKSKHVPMQVKSEQQIDRFGGNNQGAALFMATRPEMDWSALEQSSVSTVLVLDGIEDPHNLGAILRTSWLMGVKGVLIPEDRAVGLTATVHKVACGGAEHVPVEEVSSFANPIEEMKKNGAWVFGLSHEGKRSIFDLQIPEKVVWCIGAEEKGLRSTTERLCDELVSIPQISDAASYNASVAAAIALTETLRQRRKSIPEKNSPNL